MKLLFFALVVAFVAIRTSSGEAASSSGSGKDKGKTEIHYTCHVKKGLGKSRKIPINVSSKKIDTFGKCRDACIEKKKKFNRVTGVVWGIKGQVCRCLVDMHAIVKPKTMAGNFRSCHLRRDEPNEINGVNNAASANASSVVDLSYSYFKDVHCDTTWTRVGCYNVADRDRFLLNYRYDIEWEPKRHAKFAKSLVCACAEAARLNNVKYFATHYWGECWEIDQEDIKEKSDDGCLLADGEYKNKCSGVNHGGECLGTNSFYIYTNVGTATGSDKKKKRQSKGKRGIPLKDPYH